MRHAPAGVDRDGLLAWLKGCANEEARLVREEGLRRWDALPWRREWETPGWPFTEEDLASRMWAAVEFLMVEVDRCVEVGGGPYLAAMRRKERVFDVPAPSDGARPEHPLPDRWPPHLDAPLKEGFRGWQDESAPSTTQRLGKSYGRGSKTPELVSPSACSTPKVGLQAN